MTRRGDVVVVDFAFTDSGASKVRPALVVQNDHDNQKIRKTVIAMITGNTRRRGDPSHLYVDPNHPDGTSSACDSRRSSLATTCSQSTRPASCKCSAISPTH
jgi:mRNA-degrading endonuclease toxin of MazEF toxin-antitoxin module